MATNYDQYEKDANGIYIIPDNADPWGDLMRRNFDALSANKVNKGSTVRYPVALTDKYQGTSSSFITKDPFDRVFINLHISRVGDLFVESSDIICDLPVGFRPDHSISTIMSLTSSSGSLTGYCAVSWTGLANNALNVITVGGSVPANSKMIRGQMSFTASS